jgi:glucose/arabinose dehydrogenase
MVWALGVRNPQRLAWDPATGRMYVADIGQNAVEEVSPVPKGGNLGWNAWEGSFRFVGRTGVDTAGPRADGAMTYPVAEYDHADPILMNRAAVSGLVVYRSAAIPQLRGRILFGDNPSGELLHVSADDTTARGQDHVRRVLLDDGRGGEARTFLQVIRETNARQGKPPAARADLRLGTGHDDQVFLLNKADGVIRLLVPSAGGAR